MVLVCWAYSTYRIRGLSKQIVGGMIDLSSEGHGDGACKLTAEVLTAPLSNIGFRMIRLSL